MYTMSGHVQCAGHCDLSFFAIPHENVSIGLAIAAEGAEANDRVACFATEHGAEGTSR